MFEKSDMLKCLEDREGFAINEPENAPEELSSSLLLTLFDILLKYGIAEERGYRNVYYVNPIFNMKYYFGDNKMSPNPLFTIEVHHPKLFNFSTHYDFFLDNGIYVSWKGNGASVKEVWDIVRAMDSCAIKDSLKGDSLVSGSRYPLFIFHDERTHGSDLDKIEKYSKLYMKMMDINIKDCTTCDFGEKEKFLSRVPNDLKGFAPVNPEKAPDGVTPEILRDVWESVCKLGDFHTDDRKERSSLSLALKHFCVNAYCGSLDWATNLHIRSLRKAEPNSSNGHFDFELENGLKVWWDTYFSVLEVRAFLNNIKLNSALVCKDKRGVVQWVAPFFLYGAMPVFLDSNYAKQREALAFSENCKTKRTP